MKSFSEFLEELFEEVVPFKNKEFHVGAEVKVNKTGHPFHGKLAYIGHSGNVQGNSAWEHNPESEHHSVHLNNGGSFKVKDIIHSRHLQPTGKLINVESINETKQRQRKLIVRFRNGKRVRKLQCGQGMKASGNTCKRISGQEKLHRKQGSRKRSRTLRTKGGSFKRQMQRKRALSLRKRHSAGL